MSPMRLEIITVEREVFADDVDFVLAPGADGELGILPHHAPLMTTLQPGELVIRKNGEDTYLAVTGGYLEVMDNQVTVLADACERSDEIDEERAQEAMRQAEERVAMRQADMDLEQATGAMRRAQIRLNVVSRRRRREGRSTAGQPPT